MAEENNASREPPKIRLHKQQEQPAEAEPQAAPPRQAAEMGKAKSETARIDLSEAMPETQQPDAPAEAIQPVCRRYAYVPGGLPGGDGSAPCSRGRSR